MHTFSESHSRLPYYYIDKQLGGGAGLILYRFHFISTDPIPPPNDTTISRIVEDFEGSFSLTFVWSAVIFNCSSLHYAITSNCGWCPNTATETTATCRGVHVSVGDCCVFMIQSVVCGDIVGNSSDIFVDLKGEWVAMDCLEKL